MSYFCPSCCLYVYLVSLCNFWDNLSILNIQDFQDSGPQAESVTKHQTEWPPLHRPLMYLPYRPRPLSVSLLVGSHLPPPCPVASWSTTSNGIAPPPGFLPIRLLGGSSPPSIPLPTFFSPMVSALSYWTTMLNLFCAEISGFPNASSLTSFSCSSNSYSFQMKAIFILNFTGV